jgi:SAM-dependent methyltransferase
MSELLDQVKSRDWFYAYELPDGSKAPTYHDGELDAIHQTRWRMLEHDLEATFPEGFDDLNAVDLASHQGWFAVRLAQANLRRVLGIDTRASHIEDSRLIASVLGLDELRFEQSDIFDLDTDELGTFDVVLMLGLLYHLENPVGAMRLARALCRRVCYLETQVVPGISGMVDYGSYQFVRPMMGSFGVIDESLETHGNEAGTTGLCLVPSTEALIYLMGKVGFSRVELLQPPADAYEQILYGKRVMVAAYV